MAPHYLDKCHSQELDASVIPERSRLYFLEPIAIGTPYVEGLVSYICRLAEAHHVSPGVLAKQEMLPSFRRTHSVGGKTAYRVQDEGLKTSVSSFPTPKYRKNLNEYGLLSWQYIAGLEPLIMQSGLRSLTIPPWAEETARPNQTIEFGRKLRSWCPECLRAWCDTNQPIYEPLIWSIAAATVCPLHHQPLRSYCPHCQRTQLPISGRMQVGRCVHCQNWLNVQPEEPSELETLVVSEIDWHLWVTERVVEILISNSIKAETRDEIERVIYHGGQPQPDLTDLNTRQAQGILLETCLQSLNKT
ncbi:MAG: TniQ family protein [Stenomitos rutilans HA7619-LM2]|jgi:hypothetical protein|nr:TniQ family protein [Stenomitos rutilans HA7619-LM2]